MDGGAQPSPSGRYPQRHVIIGVRFFVHEMCLISPTTARTNEMKRDPEAPFHIISTKSYPPTILLVLQYDDTNHREGTLLAIAAPK